MAFDTPTTKSSPRVRPYSPYLASDPSCHSYLHDAALTRVSARSLHNTSSPCLTLTPRNTMDQAQYDQLKDSWADVEDRDGVRLAWNVIPSSKVEANRLVVPIRYVVCSGDHAHV